MANIRLTINGKSQNIDVEPETPLLWAIREQAGLTGTKYGCGVAQCGACTVHMDGRADALLRHPRERGGRQEDHHHRRPGGERQAEQGAAGLACARTCRNAGYCQSGMIMAATALLAKTPHPTDAQIDAAMTNICRLRHLPAGARSDPLGRESLRDDHDQNSETSRRAFIVSSAAVGGGLAIGFNPFGGVPVVRAADGSPEIGPWVVIRPDDTVVVRIARSEMGQGSLTGLAQMVAEELECDWNKVTWEYPTPRRERRAQARLGRLRYRRQPRHPHVARLRAQGRRDRARHAGPGGGRRLESACLGMHRRQGCDRAQGLPTARRASGKVAEAAAKLEVPKDVPLKDPKDWKIIGKPLKAARQPADKLTGKQVYGADLKLPGMLNAAIKDSPVFGGKIKSVDSAKAAAMPRREEGDDPARHCGWWWSRIPCGTPRPRWMR